jgi:hypothetical protein
MSKSIPLSQGKVALVDDADYDRLAAYQWFLSGTGYAVGFVPNGNGKFQLEYMHRFILQAAEGQLVDHINGDSLDNRQTQTNLRLATPRQNGQNRRLAAFPLPSSRVWVSTRGGRSTMPVSSTRVSVTIWAFSSRRRKQLWLMILRPDGCLARLRCALSPKEDATICGPFCGSAAQQAGIQDVLTSSERF